MRALGAVLRRPSQAQMSTVASGVGPATSRSRRLLRLQTVHGSNTCDRNYTRLFAFVLSCRSRSTPGRAGPTVSARDSGGFAGGGRPSHLRPPPPAFDEWNVGVLMKAKSPSVLRCITMATDCGQRAAIAATEADMMRELEMAVTWLEMAKAQAQSGDPSVWAEGPNNGQTSGGS